MNFTTRGVWVKPKTLLQLVSAKFVCTSKLGVLLEAAEAVEMILG